MMLKKKVLSGSFLSAAILTLGLLVLFTSLTGPQAFAMPSRKIVDMAGREIVVEKYVDKVYGAGADATVYLYSLAPDKLIGTNYAFNSAEKLYIPAKYHNLPMLGSFSGSKTNTNLEALLKADPDVLVMTSDLSVADQENANKLQKQTGIPVFIIDSSLEQTPQAYLALGKLLNSEAQAKKLFSYSYHAINGVKGRKISATKKLTVYFGNGVKSLDTAPLGSVNEEVLRLAGAKNVAALPGTTGRMEVGLEQVIKWNPGVIFLNGEPKQDLTAAQAVKQISSDKSWSLVQAVKNNRVYSIPKAPYAWIDRPSGPNRIIGLKWVGKTLYPALYQKLNMNLEIKTFYSLFYHIELTDQQVKFLLNS